MPTSAALDVVAKNLNLKFFEVMSSELNNKSLSLSFSYKNHVLGAYWVEVFREPYGCWDVFNLR
jgi:tryptophan 2,3-dioxygenase